MVFPSFTDCRSQFRFANVNGRLFAIGGQNHIRYGEGIHTSIEVYEGYEEGFPLFFGVGKKLFDQI